MITRYLALLLPIILIASSAAAQSQRPPNQDQTQRTQQAAPAEQLGTEKAPAFVKVLPADDAQAKAQQEKEDRAAKDKLDRNTIGLGIVSIVVAFLQFVAIGIQAYFLWRTIKVSEKVAESAKQSASAVVNQLRAYLSVEAKIDRNTNPFVVTITCQNKGQTPAYRTRLNAAARTFAVGTPPDYTVPNVATQSQSDIAPAGFFQNTMTLRPFPDAQETVALGRIQYRDAFGKDRSQYFRFMAGGKYGWEADGRLLVAQEGNEEREE